jgi:hypothetical protein
MGSLPIGYPFRIERLVERTDARERHDFSALLPLGMIRFTITFSIPGTHPARPGQIAPTTSSKGDHRMTTVRHTAVDKGLMTCGLIAFCTGGLLAAAPVGADERFFTYIQEADVIPKGTWEFEQWVTYRKGNPEGDKQFDQYLWDFREEVEYGLTNKLSGALYLNFRQDTIVADEPGLEDSSEFSFEGVSAELKYQLLNPNLDPIGIALYFEPTFNNNETEVEYKLILSKNLGDKWVLAANATFEQEWEKEHGETEKESVLEYTLGAAYRFTPNWSVGLEARYHSVYEGATLDDRLGSAWFLGPNIHYGSAKWWGTLTVLPQITGSPSEDSLNLTEHARYEVRLIVGVVF